MDLFNHLLGAEGCNVDGTVGSNPFTALVDSVFDNQFTSAGFQNADSSNVYFVEENLGMSSDAMGNQTQVNTMSGGFWPQSNVGNQPHYGMPMYQHPHMMNPFNQPFMSAHGMQIPQGDTTVYEYEEDYDEYDEEFDTHNEYAQEESAEYAQEAAALQTSTHEQQGTEQGPSQQGYDQAWNDLKTRLESGALSGATEHQGYVFTPAAQNPFLSALDQTTARDLNKLMEEGMRLYQAGKIKSAMLCFESIVHESDGREHDEAWRMLGACHAESDDDKRAIGCLNTALDCDPYNLEALLALGTSYVNELNSVKALETLRTWVSHNPRYQGLDLSADEYSDGTLMDEVMQLMVGVAAYDPLDVDVQVLLGVLYNVSLDYDSAIACFTAACEMRPNDYALINKLAASFANSNQCEKALPLYSQALQLRPNFVRGWLNLGISFANLDKFEDAAKAYVQALNLNPNARHIWSYVRVVLSCMDRFDLVALSGTENIVELAQGLNIELIQSD